MSYSEAITRTDLTNILNEVLPVTSKVELEYAGNVSAIHWSSWTAPDDGIVVIDIGWLTNGSFGYYYVKDNTDDIYVGKVTTYTANGTSNTTSFPVLKGHTYQVANQASVDDSHIYYRYYKFKNPTATCGLADFIVEQGTSGIWTYRKWNSGIAECWGTHSWTVTQWGAWGSAYESNESYVNYPTNLFISTPWFQATGGCDETDHVGLMSIEVWTSGSNIRTPSIIGTRPSAITGSKTVVAHLQAKGRWK